jgi:hypothetical protein
LDQWGAHSGATGNQGYLPGFFVLPPLSGETEPAVRQYDYYAEHYLGVPTFEMGKFQNSVRDTIRHSI